MGQEPSDYSGKTPDDYLTITGNFSHSIKNRWDLRTWASPSLAGKLTILENTLTIKPHLLGGLGTGFSWHQPNSVVRNYRGGQWPMARFIRRPETPPRHSWCVFAAHISAHDLLTNLLIA
jgi:hypothetical protein